MKSICGLDCCEQYSRLEACGGCRKTDGHPFGGNCMAAECIKRGGEAEFQCVKKALISEFNALGIRNLTVQGLNLLNGFFVNLEYTLPNGQRVKLLKDYDIYLGNQIEIPGSDGATGWRRMIRCFWCASTAAAEKTRRLFSIKRETPPCDTDEKRRDCHGAIQENL